MVTSRRALSRAVRTLTSTCRSACPGGEGEVRDGPGGDGRAAGGRPGTWAAPRCRRPGPPPARGGVADGGAGGGHGEGVVDVAVDDLLDSPGDGPSGCRRRHVDLDR